jgi:hypothetical protein
LLHRVPSCVKAKTASLLAAVANLSKTPLKETVSFLAASFGINAGVFANTHESVHTVLAAYFTVYFIVTLSDEAPRPDASRVRPALRVGSAFIFASAKRASANVDAVLHAVRKFNLTLLGQTRPNECLAFVVTSVFVTAIFEASTKSDLADDSTKLSTRRGRAATTLLSTASCDPSSDGTTDFRFAAFFNASGMRLSPTIAASLAASRRDLVRSALVAAGLAELVCFRCAFIAGTVSVHAISKEVPRFLAALADAASGTVGAVGFVEVTRSFRFSATRLGKRQRTAS